MGLNPFRKIDKVEEIRREAEKKKLDAQIKSCVDNAKHILSSEWGAKYLKYIEDTRDALIKYCIRNVNPDPIKDAFMLRCSLSKLATLYDLLDSIKSDSENR